MTNQREKLLLSLEQQAEQNFNSILSLYTYESFRPIGEQILAMEDSVSDEVFNVMLLGVFNMKAALRRREMMEEEE